MYFGRILGRHESAAYGPHHTAKLHLLRHELEWQPEVTVDVEPILVVVLADQNLAWIFFLTRGPREKMAKARCKNVSKNEPILRFREPQRHIIPGSSQSSISKVRCPIDTQTNVIGTSWWDERSVETQV